MAHEAEMSRGPVVRAAGPRLGTVSATADVWILSALFLLVLFAPLGKVFVHGSSVAFGADVLVAVAAILMAWTVRDRLRLTPLDWAIGALAVLGALELFNPNVLHHSTAATSLHAYVMAIVWYVAGRAAAVRLAGRRRVALLAGLTVAGVLELLWGIRQDGWYLPVDAQLRGLARSSQIVYSIAQIGTPRIFGSLPGPFHFGVLATLVTLSTLMVVRRRWWLIVIPIAEVALYLNYTRSSWLACVMALVVLVFAAPRVQKDGALLLGAPLMAAVAVAILAGPSLLSGVHLPSPPSGGAAATQVTPSPSAPAQSQPTGSALAGTGLFDLQERLNSWGGDVLPAIARAPLGYGTGAASDQLAGLGATSRYFSSHNQFFRFALEQGWLAAGLFAAALGLLLAAALRLLRRRAEPEDGVLGALLIAQLAAVGVLSLLIPVLDTYPAIAPFWVLAGIVAGRAWPARAPDRAG